MVDKDNFGFGDMVTVEVRGHEIEGEVVATGADNRDLSDDQYIIAVRGDDVMTKDGISNEEIIYEDDVISAHRP